MGLTIKEAGNGFKSAPAGTHVARCIRLIDIGTQRGEYQGKPTVRRQVILYWELPEEKTDEGIPYVASRFYTASLSEKANLRKDLEAWRGRAFREDELAGFDLRNVLGKPCMLSIVEREGGGTKIGGVMSLPKGMNVPAQINESVVFDLDEWDEQVFQGLSDGLKKLIQASDEYAAIRGSVNASHGFEDMADEIPF